MTLTAYAGLVTLASMMTKSSASQSDFCTTILQFRGRHLIIIERRQGERAYRQQRLSCHVCNCLREWRVDARQTQAESKGHFGLIPVIGIMKET